MSDNQSLSSKKSCTTHFSKGSLNPFQDASDSASKDDSHQREKYQPPEVAKQEEANIVRAKILVALIILLAASGVGTATYLLVKDQERATFENQFAGYSSEILTVTQQKVDQFFSALDAFSASVSSQAESENALRNTSWPFYVVPDWSIKAQRLAQLTGVYDPELAIIPIVGGTELVKFNEFAIQAIPMWYQESIENENIEKTVDEFMRITVPFIFFHDPENNYFPTPLTGESLELRPLFQFYPLKAYDGFPLMQTMYDTVMAPGQVELAKISSATRKPSVGFVLVGRESGSEIPGSQILQPIYDTADTNAEDRKIVAYTGIKLHWLDYFKNILTDGEFGIIVVLRSACPNRCGEIFQVNASSVVSYRIDGQNAEYLGDSDMHNPKYDSMEIADVFVDIGVDESELPE
eukprot:scaffold2929_cov107-Cylindrotheca_fusiformis.AAC.1